MSCAHTTMMGKRRPDGLVLWLCCACRCLKTGVPHAAAMLSTRDCGDVFQAAPLDTSLRHPPDTIVCFLPGPGYVSVAV